MDPESPCDVIDSVSPYDVIGSVSLNDVIGSVSLNDVIGSVLKGRTNESVRVFDWTPRALMTSLAQ